jgi:hypothetical protein
MKASLSIPSYTTCMLLQHWLQHLEVYFSVHNIDEEHKISFSQLKLEGHALTWWGSHMETLRLEGDQ